MGGGADEGSTEWVTSWKLAPSWVHVKDKGAQGQEGGPQVSLVGTGKSSIREQERRIHEGASLKELGRAQRSRRGGRGPMRYRGQGEKPQDLSRKRSYHSALAQEYTAPISTSKSQKP